MTDANVAPGSPAQETPSSAAEPFVTDHLLDDHHLTPQEAADTLIARGIEPVVLFCRRCGEFFWVDRLDSVVRPLFSDAPVEQVLFYSRGDKDTAVAVLLARGVGRREIARTLEVSEHRVSAVKWAIEHPDDDAPCHREAPLSPLPGPAIPQQPVRRPLGPVPVPAGRPTPHLPT